MKLLERVVVAAPCPMSWDNMSGDDKVRHCSGCERNVYNLSAMSDTEAESFLQVNGSSQCLTFYRRADGTVMTDNCPRGLKAIRDRITLWSRVAAGFVASVISFGVSADAQKSSERVQKTLQNQQNNSSPPPGVGGAVWIPPAGSDANSGQAQTPKQNVNRTLGEPMPQNQLPMNAAGGISFTPVPVGKKTVLMPNECSKNGSPNKLPANIEPVSGDKAAYNLFTEAQNNKVAGKELLALTQFKSALNLSKGMKHADPQFMRLIETEIAGLQAKLQNKPATAE
jgi:hypothetical protein